MSKADYSSEQAIVGPLRALRKVLEATRTVASAVVVDEAKDENAVKFYKRYGFIATPDHPDRLFIPMATVRQLLSEDDELDRNP